MADLDILDVRHSASPSDEEVLHLANRLLEEFNIPTKILHIGDISSALFVILYERLFSDTLPGIVRQPITVEDEILNCQTVIDVLSTDIVRENLSHIQGSDIVGGNVTAIFNLLDIFSHLLEYVVNKIESDVPTDTEDSRSVVTEDTDVGKQKALREEIGDAVKKDEYEEMSRRNGAADRKNGYKQRDKKDLSLNKNENRNVITHEDYYALTRGGVESAHGNGQSFLEPPSPIKPDQSQSLLGQKTIDSTDLDFESRDAEQKVTSSHPVDKDSRFHKIAWSGSPTDYAPKTQHFDDAEQLTGENDELISGAAVGCASSIPTASQRLLGDEKRLTASSKSNGEPKLAWSDVYPKTGEEMDKSKPQFTKSLPQPSEHLESNRADPLRSTIGPIDYQSHPAPEEKHYERKSDPPLVKGLSSSYNDLQHLVEKTAMLTRVALKTSPVRIRAEREFDITGQRDEQCPRPTISSEGVRLAKELNSQSLRASESRETYKSLSKGSKKVAFSISSTDALESRGSRYRPALSTLYSNRSDFTSGNDYPEDRYQSDLTAPGFSSSCSDVKSRSSQPHPQKKTKTKTEAFAKHLARSRQPELGAAHMTLQTEDRAMKKKQEILKQLYEEDLEEFADDVDRILSKEKKGSKEVEEKLLKTYQERAPLSKGTKKSKGSAVSASYKKPKSSRVVSSKAKRKSSSGAAPQSSVPMKFDSTDEIMPVLLEEFAYLHLSEHTWHELWRKGLQQIESLTNAYQESKRKKSQAQCQLEEAAKRHEMLSDIMRKQLEHTKRLREIKEQKATQIHVRNKVHDKRMQSARARRYYNEYQVRARSKQLKRRTKEEMVFRELFRDALGIQKERIKDIRQYSSEQRKRQESRRQNEMESLENFYNDQFVMLAERLAKERQESSLRDGAQQRMLDQMKRELRKKMEAEIRQYQDQLYHDEDDSHFRQIDADRVKQQLHMARYTARI